jgi:hypothetical protein
VTTVPSARDGCRVIRKAAVRPGSIPALFVAAVLLELFQSSGAWWGWFLQGYASLHPRLLVSSEKSAVSISVYLRALYPAIVFGSPRG